MNSDNKKRFNIEIEKSEHGTVIRVHGVDRDSFDDAYTLINDLSERAAELDSIILVSRRIEEAKRKIAPLLFAGKERMGISNLVSQKSHRIALSLLKAYPEYRTEVEVVNDTELPRGTVHTQLTGRTKSVMVYFKHERVGYTLSRQGIEWVLDEVIPFLVSKHSLEE